MEMKKETITETKKSLTNLVVKKCRMNTEIMRMKMNKNTIITNKTIKMKEIIIKDILLEKDLINKANNKIESDGFYILIRWYLILFLDNTLYKIYLFASGKYQII